MPSAVPGILRYPSSLTSIATGIGYIFKLPAPVAAQVDSIHINVRILSALQRMITPILNVDICFLIQLTDGGGKDFTALQRLSNVFYTPDNTPAKHISTRASSTATVSFNDCCFKTNSLEFRYLQGDIPGSGGEITVVVAAKVAQALLVGLSQLSASAPSPEV